ncbi:MAG: S-layer homology domain-containing protein [Firmicutes bacterium]|nr:S-layer homology domain-containing protein [Bacillota bacterium]
MKQKKTVKKAIFTLLCLTAFLVLLLGPNALADFQTLTVNAVLSPSTLEESSSEQQVTLTVTSAQPIALDGIEYRIVPGWSGAEITSTAGVAGTDFSGSDFNCVNGVGFVGWSTADSENVTTDQFGKFTITVPANTAGTYTVQIQGLETSKDYGDDGYRGSAQATLTINPDPSVTRYNVTVIPANNGSFDVDKTIAAEGDIVRIKNISPANGYELDKITYTPAGGSARDITTARQFNMPAANVTVEAVFAQVQPQIIEVNGVTLNKHTASLEEQETLQLRATVSPNNASDKTVTWYSSDNAIARVSQNGLVTAVKKGEATITAKAGNYTDECDITVTAVDPQAEFGLKPEEIVGYVRVSFEDNGKRKSTELSEIESDFRSPLGTIISATRVPFKKNDTIASVTLRLLKEKGITPSYQGSEFSGFYLEAISGFTVNGKRYGSFGEFDAGRDSGWMITWNDWFINKGASEFNVKDGDVVRWQYTCQLGADIGNTFDENDEDMKAAAAVKKLIDAIGTVTKDSGDAIQAARNAYDKLTAFQKRMVSNYDILQAAEKKYAELTQNGQVTPVTPVTPGNTDGMAFADVDKNAYYYPALQWAVSKGITQGTSATAFSPNAGCSRAQMVTFLWRASGSPQAQSAACSFTDVDKNAYYYPALLWAVEKGVTAGTSATAFSPNAGCSRAQMVTFLWRSAGSPQAQNTACSFTDVNKSAYYYPALLWAVEKGVTAGTSATAFSPNAGCSRAQMVTFLYRYLGN